MRINAKTAALILPLFFLVGIGSTMISGYWRTESSKVPAKFAEGELAGEYDPGDIRGSYSFADLEKAFEIPVETLAKAFGLSDAENPAVIQIKVFEEEFGMIEEKEIGTDSMRLFISLYLDRPYLPEETTALPQPAYNILKKEGAASAETLEKYADRVVPLDSVHLSEEALSGAHEEELETGLLEVKGKTTFAEVLDAGISEDQIVQALGGKPMGPRALSVRDYCKENGIEFSVVKAALMEMLE